MSKGSSIVGAIGVAVLAGLVVATMGNADKRQRDQEIREACHQVGEVMQECPSLFPAVPVCQLEDCSDIAGLAGYWRDPVDSRVYLTLSPETKTASQRAES